LKYLNLKNINRVYNKASFEIPFSGWLGFFIEFELKGIEGKVIKLSTETNIIPSFYPFDDCFKEKCRFLSSKIFFTFEPQKKFF